MVLPIFSDMLGVGGAGGVPEGNSSCMGTLGSGEGLLSADRCCRVCSTQRGALAEGCDGLGRCSGLGM